MYRARYTACGQRWWGDCGGSFFNQLDQFLPEGTFSSVNWTGIAIFALAFLLMLWKSQSHFIDLVFSQSGDCFLFGTGVYSILEMLKSACKTSFGMLRRRFRLETKG